MPIEPSLVTSLTWFAHIARHRSFTKAATEMEITRAALSQHLKALEERLDVRLLHRTTRNMSLTEEGQQLLDVLQPALTAIEKAVEELGEVHAEPSGVIRMNSSRIASRLLLEPHMGEFLARYPKLRLELIMDDGFSNLVANGLDAGIRLGESLDEHMVAVPITPPLEMAIVGSPAYFEQHGIPETPADLIRQRPKAGLRTAGQRGVQRRRQHAPGSAAGCGTDSPHRSVRQRAPGQRCTGARAGAVVPSISRLLPVRPIARPDAGEGPGIDGLPGRTT